MMKSIKYNNKVSNRKASEIENLEPLQIAGQFYNQILEIYFNKFDILTKYMPTSNSNIHRQDKLYYSKSYGFPLHEMNLIKNIQELVGIQLSKKDRKTVRIKKRREMKRKDACGQVDQVQL